MPHLVLADDSPAIQKIIELSFADEEIEIHCFADSKSALEYVNTHSADVLLADISLPGLDGYELCRVIRQNPSTARIPVVLLVGALQRFDVERAEQVGYNFQLTKPLGSSQLVDLIKNLLDASTSPPALFSLTPSQCRAIPPAYAREFSPPVESKPAIEDDALSSSEVSVSDDEINLLESRLLERLQQELRRILPEVARDVIKGR
ncbi:response regulator [Acidobacteria bacterium AH-259-G07]|nr:response regulator [Acidobacteria bacterium AH-259-G07]